MILAPIPCPVRIVAQEIQMIRCFFGMHLIRFFAAKDGLNNSAFHLIPTFDDLC